MDARLRDSKPKRRESRATGKALEIFSQMQEELVRPDVPCRTGCQLDLPWNQSSDHNHRFSGRRKWSNLICCTAVMMAGLH